MIHIKHIIKYITIPAMEHREETALLTAENIKAVLTFSGSARDFESVSVSIVREGSTAYEGV